MAISESDAIVLIADDHADSMYVALELLRRAGVRACKGYASGRQLLEALAGQEGRIDLIVLDIRMPREDGYAILKQIRANNRLAETRVVALTANVMADDVERARAAGFDGFIGKPIDHQRFPRQIRRILAGEAVWEPR
jgi:two-component system cell cycle response regulator DivK